MSEHPATLQASVPRELHGLRIDVALAKLFPHYSRSQLGQWLKQGLIQVNQQPCKAKDKASFGDEIVFLVDTDTLSINESLDKAQDLPLNVVFEDDALLVVNKPAGLVVHPGAGNRNGTLVNALLHHYPQQHALPRAGIIHRLDKDTSGLLLVAKTLPAYTLLTRKMQDREIDRRYLTLVHGQIISGGSIQTYFGRHPRNRLKMAVCQSGREAITHYQVQKRYASISLLEVTLETGRTHQIRVHMAHINHPVIGDPLYSGQRRIPAKLTPALRDAIIQFKRQALHAWSLHLSHPLTGEDLTFEAKIPDDFQHLIHLLDYDASNSEG